MLSYATTFSVCWAYLQIYIQIPPFDMSYAYICFNSQRFSISSMIPKCIEILLPCFHWVYVLFYIHKSHNMENYRVQLSFITFMYLQYVLLVRRSGKKRTYFNVPSHTTKKAYPSAWWFIIILNHIWNGSERQY